MNAYLINGDCLEKMKKIPDESVDLIVIDPPYKMTARGSHGNTGGMLKTEIGKSGKVFKYNDIVIEDYIEELYRVLKESGHCYIMTNHKNITHFLNVADTSKFHFIKNCIWLKDNKIMGQFYMNQFEYILFLRKGKAKRINNCGTSEVLQFANKKTKINGENIHPTEKPVDLLETLIKNSSNESDIVLDCFMGSGSTGVACKNTNRNFIGIELDKNYFNIAKERIENEN